MTATVFTMSPKERMVSLQFQTPLAIRARLRSVASLEYLDMGEVAGAIFEYVFSVMDSGKIPPALTAAFDKARKEKERKKSESEKDV